MEHLVPRTRNARATARVRSPRNGKHVVIIGGGDTGADCLGTAHRQGAAVGHPAGLQPGVADGTRRGRSPWPAWPMVLRTSPAHAEGGVRRYQVAVQRFVGDENGNVAFDGARRGDRVTRDSGGRTHHHRRSARRSNCLVNWPFSRSDSRASISDRCSTTTGCRPPAAVSLSCGPDWQTTAPGVFVCGDAHRGASLVVWAIAEGRSAAHAVDVYSDGQHRTARSRPPDRAAARRRSPLNSPSTTVFSCAFSFRRVEKGVAGSTRLEAVTPTHEDCLHTWTRYRHR